MPTPASNSTILDGAYTVEVLDTFGESFSAFRPAYKLTGKRGAQYVLFRNEKYPHSMFSVNAKDFTANAKARGYEWFTDENGTLKPIK